MMKTLFDDFRLEITDLYKAYKMCHFSLYHTLGTYEQSKIKNPQIKTFSIRDESFTNEVEFDENELDKNSENGLYQRVIAGNTIAMFYNIWEDKYRLMIAKNANSEKNDIKNEFFADLNRIRQSITHNHYNPIGKLNKLQKLNFIGNSSILKLSSFEVYKIYDQLLVEIENLRNLYCG